MLHTILILLFMLLASPSWAGVVFDTVSSSGGASQNTTSHSHTFASNANLAIIIISLRDGGGAVAAVSTVTVGGQSATLISGCARNNSTNLVRVEIWALVRPPTGAQTVAADASAGAVNDDMLTGVLSFSGAAGSNTFGTCVTTAGTTTNVDVDSIGSDIGEMGVLGLSANTVPTCAADATSPVSTEKYDVAAAGNLRGCGYIEDGAASSINMRVDLSGSVVMAATGVSIRAARGHGSPILLQ